jgi:hypothetical protein
MPEMMNARPVRHVITCFSDLDSRNLNNLILISLYPRVTCADASVRRGMPF